MEKKTKVISVMSLLITTLIGSISINYKNKEEVLPLE